MTYWVLGTFLDMISIIIPVFNHDRELKQCLESIAAQTYKAFEIIVVDDGSTPALNAGEFSISNFQFPNKSQITNPKSRIQFLRQEHQGAPTARNLGFRHSHGEYVMFCDADVMMREDMLEKMLKELESNNSPQPPLMIRGGEGGVKSPAYVYSGFRLGRKTMSSFPFSPERLKKMPYIHTTSLIRREAFPGFDESLKKFQDWDLYLTMLEKGYSGLWIPEVLYSITPRQRYGMSFWLPSFMYKIPWKKLGLHFPAITRYDEGMIVIKTKHRI